MAEWKYGTIIKDEGAQIMVIGQLRDGRPPIMLATETGDWFGVVIQPDGKFYKIAGQVEYVPESPDTAWDWEIVSE